MIRRRLRERWLQRQPEDLRRALRLVDEERALAARTRRSAQAFDALTGRGGLRVHLGCGRDVRAGWVNIDMSAFPAEVRAAHESRETLLIEHDLRRGLPLPAGCARLIYSSHFFEHLEYPAFRRLLADCHRVLAAEGALRLCLPDFHRIFEAYFRKDAEYLALLRKYYANYETTPATEALVDGVQYAVHQYGQHKCVFDREKLGLLLAEAGFQDVREVEFEPGLDMDWDVRRQYSLYFEARKTA